MKEDLKSLAFVAFLGLLTVTAIEWETRSITSRDNSRMEESMSVAESEGRAARISGLSENANPYRGAAHHVSESRAWVRGFAEQPQ